MSDLVPLREGITGDSLENVDLLLALDRGAENAFRRGYHHAWKTFSVWILEALEHRDGLSLDEIAQGLGIWMCEHNAALASWRTDSAKSSPPNPQECFKNIAAAMETSRDQKGHDVG